MEKEIWALLLDKTLSGEIVWKKAYFKGMFNTTVQGVSFHISRWNGGLAFLNASNEERRTLFDISGINSWPWTKSPSEKLFEYIRDQFMNNSEELEHASKLQVLSVLESLA